MPREEEDSLPQNVGDLRVPLVTEKQSTPIVYGYLAIGLCHSSFHPHPGASKNRGEPRLFLCLIWVVIQHFSWKPLHSSEKISLNHHCSVNFSWKGQGVHTQTHTQAYTPTRSLLFAVFFFLSKMFTILWAKTFSSYSQNNVFCLCFPSKCQFEHFNYSSGTIKANYSL